MEVVAIDCVMVGAGRRGGRDLAARVTILNDRCQVLLDIYVKHKIQITDYRRGTTRITPELLDTATSYKEVRRLVADYIRKRILVGYRVEHMLRVLRLTNIYTREISEPFKTSKSRPTLKELAANYLHMKIQWNGIHDSRENASAAMQIYKMYEEEFECDEEEEEEEGEYEEEEEEEEGEYEEEEYEEEESEEEMNYYSSSSSD